MSLPLLYNALKNLTLVIYCYQEMSHVLRRNFGIPKRNITLFHHFWLSLDKKKKVWYFSWVFPFLLLLLICFVSLAYYSMTLGTVTLVNSKSAPWPDHGSSHQVTPESEKCSCCVWCFWNFLRQVDLPKDILPHFLSCFATAAKWFLRHISLYSAFSECCAKFNWSLRLQHCVKQPFLIFFSFYSKKWIPFDGF